MQYYVMDLCIHMTSCTADQSTTKHTHTHFFLTPCPHGRWAGSSCYTSSQNLGWVDLDWWIALHHALLSVTTSCHSGISVRSLLMTSTHHKQVLSASSFLSVCTATGNCFCGRWSGILCRCPNHWSLFSLSCSLIGSSLVSSSMLTLHRISHRVTPTMSQSLLIWNIFSLLMSCWVTVQVSAPYSSTNMTIAQNTCTLVLLLSFDS